ncbi:uncharacterized protein LOC111372621 [Olea europaea var. sylvestris]|uniref:uncharacterized protein LOC111372621 n=1 Tax=Olea europaea var. sylvestris TaxID=158386 RepID=UPI000C1D695F|nr:uncharacterized protein LOC111372621 [Olea europaea var. sylvestris]
MVRFSVGGSEGEEDRESNNRKRPVSENCRTYINGGYQDIDEHGSYSIRLSNNKPRPSMTFTKKPRFAIPSPSLSPTPKAAACATTSAASQQRCKILEYRLFGRINDGEEEEEDDDEHDGDEEEEPMEEMEEEAHESSDKEDKTDGQLSVILSDPEVLDCLICFEPLTLPVFQCENGHIACAPCCTKMLNRCGNCSLPIGYNRCRAIEKVVESVKISCQNAGYGCKLKISYSYKLDHERACIYMPCSCPHLACNYVGSFEALYTHSEINHSNCSQRFHFSFTVSISLDKNQEQLFLQDKTERTLFVLNRSIDRLGSLFNVVCIGPTSAKRRYSYTITAKDGRESSIKLESVADNMPKWITHPPGKKYLLVPNDFVGSSGRLNLEVIIWHPDESPVALNAICICGSSCYYYWLNWFSLLEIKDLTVPSISLHSDRFLYEVIFGPEILNQLQHHRSVQLLELKDLTVPSISLHSDRFLYEHSYTERSLLIFFSVPHAAFFLYFHLSRILISLPSKKMGRSSARRSEGGDSDSNKKWPVYGKRRTYTKSGDRPSKKNTGSSVALSGNPRFSTPVVTSSSTGAERATTSAALQLKAQQRIPGRQEEPILVNESAEGTEEDSEEESEEETEEESEEPKGECSLKRQVSVIFPDLDFLDCPIYLEPLGLPVFQCKNGHIACKSCCTKMRNKCGSCSLQIGLIRCRAIETVIESIKIKCRNGCYGCPETMLYNEKLGHEEACDYVPCSCPQLDCDYVGPHIGLLKHIEAEHSDSCEEFTFGCSIGLSLNTNQKQIILRETSEGVVFVLNHFIEDLGSLINVVCTGLTSEKRRYSYLLTSEDGESSIKLESVADNVPKWTLSTPLKNFLLVPKNFIASNEQIKLNVTIYRSTNDPL